MPSSAAVIEEARRLIKKRLTELEDERRRLEHAVAQLGASRPGPGRRQSPPRRPRVRRRRGGRSAQVQKLISVSPGATVPDIAKKLKVKPPYLYTLLGKLTKEGSVQKRGRQYFPPA